MRPRSATPFLFLISGYKLEDAATLKRQGASSAPRLLGAANEIMAKNDRRAAIEELYFTSLVIQ